MDSIPAIIVPHMSFGKLPLRWFLEDLEELRKQQKQLFDYRWDSRNFFVSNINGCLFAFLPSVLKDVVELTFWDAAGHVCLGEVRILRADLDRSISGQALSEWRNIQERMDAYVRGLIHCSDCDKEIPLHPQKNAYFAGRYCDDCWERKWKAIEVAENYN